MRCHTVVLPALQSWEPVLPNYLTPLGWLCGEIQQGHLWKTETPLGVARGHALNISGISQNIVFWYKQEKKIKGLFIYKSVYLLGKRDFF